MSEYKKFDDEWVWVGFKDDRAVSFTRIGDVGSAAKFALEEIKKGYEIKIMTWDDMCKAMTKEVPAEAESPGEPT